MVVCTYFNQGYCRYGDRCRFDHPFKGPSASSGANFRGQSQPTTAVSSATPGSFTELLNGIATEMRTWENSQQWPFSCFSPLKGQPCIPGLSDLSPEELRAEAYKSKAANTPDVYLRFFNSQVSEYRQKRASLHNASPEMRQYMQQMFSASVSGGAGGSSVFGGGAPQSTKSLFGGGSGTTSMDGLFGKSASQQTNSSSVFGGQTQPTSSVFGGQTQPSGSVFGGQTQPTGSVFSGQSQSTGSVFSGQTQPSGSVFGGQSQSTGSVFGGQTQPSGSVFGGQTQSTGSVFGGQTQPSGSVFGGQTQPTSSVFGGQTQPSGSVFGGQTQPTNSVFGGKPPATSVGQAQPVGSVFSGQTQVAAPPSGPVLGSSQPPPPSAAGSGLFGKGTSAAPTQPQSAAAADAYSEPTELNDQDRAQFAAPEFTLGKVPLRPPTREMCAR